jgi:hypothetical protein
MQFVGKLIRKWHFVQDRAGGVGGEAENVRELVQNVKADYDMSQRSHILHAEGVPGALVKECRSVDR